MPYILEAMTLAPMRCSQCLEVGHGGIVSRTMDRLMEVLTRWYKSSLDLCLGNRWRMSVGTYKVNENLRIGKLPRQMMRQLQGERGFAVSDQTLQTK